MVVTEISLIHHVGIVLILLWLLNSYSCCHPILYFVSLIYLYQVHERYSKRLRRKLQFEERKTANQRRILTDSETVRWLNHAVEKMWPICIEQIISLNIFLPIMPWFLKKYKPWTVAQAAVESLYLGRTPPLFTDMRVLHESSDDDHLVLELGLNFLTADDMSAILSAKLRKSVGFGIGAKMHLTGVHVEGKVLVGVKFLRSWPYIGRLRVCFAEPPYFQMNVKPVIPHGLDVTELPGIAGWLDNLLAGAFKETLVEPNMLVVDLEKLFSPEPENWFSVDVKGKVAQVNVEVIEAAELKPSDLNGLADPYVKGHFGPFKFSTQIQRKTLTPKWLEEFKVPICSWDSLNMLEFEVCDKDNFKADDVLGNCSVNISELRDGQRHDMWLSLEHVKMGRLHLAITVSDVNEKEKEDTGEEVKTDQGDKPDPVQCEMAEHESQKMSDTFEPINVEGQRETGIWVHHPGSDTCQAWEPRRGKSRHLDSEILSVESSGDESTEGRQAKRGNIFQRGIMKLFHRHHPKRDESFGDSASLPHANVKPVHVKRVGVNLVMGDPTSNLGGVSSNEGSEAENSGKDDAKGLSNENSEEGISSDDESSVGGIPINSSFITKGVDDEAEPDERVRNVVVTTSGSAESGEVSIEEPLKPDFFKGNNDEGKSVVA